MELSKWKTVTWLRQRFKHWVKMRYKTASDAWETSDGCRTSSVDLRSTCWRCIWPEMVPSDAAGRRVFLFHTARLTWQSSPWSSSTTWQPSSRRLDPASSGTTPRSSALGGSSAVKRETEWASCPGTTDDWLPSTSTRAVTQMLDHVFNVSALSHDLTLNTKCIVRLLYKERQCVRQLAYTSTLWSNESHYFSQCKISK